MTDLAKLRDANARRWAAMQVHPAQLAAIDAAAKRLAAPAAKARYQAVAARTGVPWFVIAVIHEREAAQRWTANIAQGDPWNAASRHVPAGRGPFASWEDAAVDALTNCAPHAARNRDWSAGGALTLLEQYNGTGYAARGVPSPYIWAASDQYTSGKYVADHDYDPDAVDRQIGCAALIKRMAAIDPSATFAPAPASAAPAAAQPAPPSAKPAAPSKAAAPAAPAAAGMPPAKPAPRPPAPPQPPVAAAKPAGRTVAAATVAAAGGAVAAHQAGLGTGTIVGILVLVAVAVIAVVLASRKT